MYNLITTTITIFFNFKKNNNKYIKKIIKTKKKFIKIQSIFIYK